jgi:hypothetical protein
MSRTIPGMSPEPKPCAVGGIASGIAALTPCLDGCTRRVDQPADSELTLQPTAARDSALASRNA